MSQRSAEGATIISPIRHELVRSAPRTTARTSHANSVQCLFGQLDLRYLGAVEVKAQRQSMAIHHQHPFGSFSHLGNADLLATPLRRRERAVKEGHRPVERTLLIESGLGHTLNALPHALLAPAFEPLPRCRRRAILARQILPITSSDEDVEDAFNGSAVVGTWTTCARWWWQERFDKGPLAIGQMNAAHMSRLIQRSSVSESPLSRSAEVMGWQAAQEDILP